MRGLLSQLTLDLGFRTTKADGFIERSMPTTFNISQLTSFDNHSESETNGPMGNTPLSKNTIKANLSYTEELNLEPL